MTTKICTKCGISQAEAAVIGALIALGCKTPFDPETCNDGKPHDWREQAPKEAT